MSIIYHESTQTFHLTNGKISYLMKVFPDGTNSSISARRSGTGRALTTCWR